MRIGIMNSEGTVTQSTLPASGCLSPFFSFQPHYANAAVNSQGIGCPNSLLTQFNLLMHTALTKNLEVDYLVLEHK